MLENFIFSLNSVVPIFSLVVIGYFLKKKDFLDKHTVNKLNNIVFKCSLPSMLFVNVATGDIKKNFDPIFLSYVLLFTFGTFAFSWILAELFIKDKSSIGSFVQGTFRGNYSIMGISIIGSILGDADTGKSVLIMTFLLPLYNILSVIVLSFRNEDSVNNPSSNGLSSILVACKEIIKNPLIIGIFLGLPFAIFSIKLPIMVTDSIGNLGSLTMPIALLCIGADIDFNSSFKNLKLPISAMLLKQVLYPIFAVLISVYLGIRGEELVIMFVMTSTPTAVSSFIMAKNMKSNPRLAANIILFTTIMSLISFTFGIYILKTFSLI